MTVRTKELKFSTRGGEHIIDITEDVGRLVSKSKIKEGIVTVFVPGSTGAITTISGFQYIYRGLNILQEEN